MGWLARGRLRRFAGAEPPRALAGLPNPLAAASAVNDVGQISPGRRQTTLCIHGRLGYGGEGGEARSSVALLGRVESVTSHESEGHDCSGSGASLQRLWWVLGERVPIGALSFGCDGPCNQADHAHRGRRVARFLINAPSEFVADMICARLSEAGIQPRSIGASARPATLAGGRDIYVEDDELNRAREVLHEAESSSESEPSAASE
jgi:hypothetical protein